MKKILTIILFLPLTTFATGRGHETSGNQAQNANLNAFQSTTVKSSAEASAFSGAVVKDVSSNSTGGSSTSQGGEAKAVNGGNRTTFNQVQQTPFAFAPSTNVGVGKYKCKDGASLGASSGPFAIGGGMAVSDDVCEKLVKADWLSDHGLDQEACEMVLLDNDIKDVFKKTGRTCKPKQVQVIQQTNLEVYDKMDAIADEQIKFINKKLGK